MADIKINGYGNLQNLPLARPEAQTQGKGFEDVMQEAMGSLAQVQKDTERAVTELTSGGDITQAMIAMEKADMSFQLMVEIRNRLINAYEEISRMQV